MKSRAKRSETSFRRPPLRLAQQREGLTTILIVNFNAGPLLAACVVAALRSRSPVEVAIADNGSEDQSLAMLRGEVGGDPRLQILECQRNLGFARANNRILPWAHGDYLLFLNPDCLIEPDTIDRMRQAMDAHPRAGMGGCLILNPDRSEQPGCRRTVPTPWRSLMRVTGLHRLARWFPSLEDFDLRRAPLPMHPVAVEAISGAFMLVRRDALLEVGPLDEGYFLHCEDLDWCQRFRQGGWDVLFVPDVEVVHHRGTCSHRRAVRVHWHKHRGMLRFYRKYFAQHYSWHQRWLIPVGVWLRFALTLPLEIFRGVWARRPSA